MPDLKRLKEELAIAKLYRRLAISRGETIEFAELDCLVQKLEAMIEEFSE